MTLSPEHRAKISEARARAWDRYYDSPPPTSKQCSQCKQVKVVPDDFPMRKRKRKNGQISVTPGPECKKCAAERAARGRRAKTVAKRTADRKRWYAGRDREKVRAYNREYGRLRRERDGATVRGPWVKYRTGIEAAQVKVDPALFLEWAEWVRPQLDPNEASVIYDAKARGFRLDIRLIDAVMTRYGAADQFAVFYGDIEQ